ncbi:MAG: Fe-S cluster assembly sulfur transfer protein SufU [Candidatus Micrarchaeia archaeon]
MNNNDIYAEKIIAHYEHPHNKSKLENADITYHGFNPYCGDDITIYMNIEDDIVKDVRFDGNGCAISISSASMLTDFIKGKKIDDVKKLGFKDMVKLIGIDPGPARLKCMMLPVKTIQDALNKINKKN